MNISLRTRRRRTVVGGTVLTLAIGGLAAALPAQANAGPSATSAPAGIAAADATATSTSTSTATATATSSSIPIQGGSPPRASYQPVVTDSLNPGGVTAPDAILTCSPTQIAEGITVSYAAIPVGCLTLYNGEWVRVAWTDHSGYMQLTQQLDGNLVLTINDGTTSTTPWASNTTKSNSAGPGCFAQFQSNADLVVSNCAHTLIWDSTTHTYPDAVLVFQMNNNLVIEETPGGTALWATNTATT